MGDIQQDLGQADRSHSHWQRAADRLENDFPGQSNPNIIDLRSALWLRLGRQAEAARLIDRLAEMGYQPRF